MNQISDIQVDKSIPTALYHQLKEAIKREIWSSKLKIGSRITPERQLCKVYGVSRSTATRALAELVDEGVLVREQGRGTFVADPGKRVDQTFTLGVALYDSQYIMLPFFSAIIAGISEVAGAAGYQIQLIVTNAASETDEESLYSRMLSHKKVDGLAVVDHYVSDKDIIDLHSHGVPIVLFDRIIPGHDFCSVLVDSRGGAFQLVEHLYEIGHRNIGFVTVNLAFPPARERYEGYRSVLQIKGLEFHPEWIIEHPNEAHTDILARELSRVASLPISPTALICHDDQAALKTISVLRKLKHRVPEDFSVTGFDNIPHLEFASPALTTVDPRLTELGGQMAKMLLAQIRDEDIPSRRFVGKAQVITRKSTAPPKIRG